jgi:hypothetical protein
MPYPARLPSTITAIECYVAKLVVVSFQDMPLRFRRSIRVAPGIRVNLGLHGAGLSVGPRGLHVGVNRRGMYTSAGIP